MMEPTESPLAVVCDFDGTITTDDVAVALLTRFATGDWESCDDDLRASRISVGVNGLPRLAETSRCLKRPSRPVLTSLAQW